MSDVELDEEQKKDDKEEKEDDDELNGIVSVAEDKKVCNENISLYYHLFVSLFSYTS